MDQLRDATLEDEDLMRGVLTELIDDTARQIELLGRAIMERNARETVRLAHCSRGACATVGARSSAAVLMDIEHTAATGDFDKCGESLRSLAAELAKLRRQSSAMASSPRF